MTTLYYTYTFIIGLLLGSFYNVVGLRIPKKESIIYPASHCTKCNRTLKSYELIPIISYLFLRGKCKGCNTSISSIYPFMELVTALLFIFAPYYLGWSTELLIAWTLISLLVIIFISDIHYMIIPDKVLLFFGALILILRIFIPTGPWWEPFLGAMLGFTLLLLIAIISKGGMGGGDIKLFAVLGLVLGWKGVLLTLLFSAMIGTIVGLIGMVLGKVQRGKPIPFGPSIAAGALISYFFGNFILGWYLNYFSA